MIQDTNLLQIYNILVDKGLNAFFSAFCQELDITNVEDFLHLSLTDLYEIGIVSHLDIRRFENVVEDLQDENRRYTNYQQENGNAFAVDVILLNQDPVVISVNEIVCDEILGSGNFGKVFKGTWNKKYTSNKVVNIPVAVKTLADGSEMSWKKEVSIFTALNQNHPSIIKFFGLLIGDQDEVKMVTEFAAFGSLIHRLQARNITSIAILSQFAVQIASGMVFLHSKNLVHRDLSARNILVTAKNQVKISDFGLSKILGDTEDEWVMESNEMLPMRWLAPESYNSGIFTMASDIWSFAVVLWEMFTFGDLPWPEYDNEQVKEKIENGTPLPEPNVCPHGFYDVMLMCFCYDADERPPFHIIRDELIAQQPDTVLTVEEQTGHYVLNFTKNEYVTAIKPVSETNPDLWLGQHESSLLFGCFNLNSTTIIDFNIPLERVITEDTGQEMVAVTTPSTSSSAPLNDKANHGEGVNEPCYQIPNNISNYDHVAPASTRKRSDSQPTDSLNYKNLPSDATAAPLSRVKRILAEEQRVRPRSAVLSSGLPERTVTCESLKSDSDSKLLFKDTNPVVQETVNDRIARNMKAFLCAAENKDDTMVFYKNLDYIVPVDVSVAPSLDSVINSVDPYPRHKALSQENIYEQIPGVSHTNMTTRSHSSDTLIQGLANRPRPKPKQRIADGHQQTSLNAYAESVKKDLVRFAKDVEKSSPHQSSNPVLPKGFSDKRVLTSELTDNVVRNREYLSKFSQVILVENNVTDTLRSYSSETVAHSNVNKGFESDNSKRNADNNSYILPAKTQTKHFSYDADSADGSLSKLPMSTKETTKCAGTNYRNNDWHLFEDSVKDSKKTDKIRRKGSERKINEISWPRDMSKMSRDKKEEFSAIFKKIKTMLPNANVSECLEGLRYSDNDVTKAVKYIQVQKLTQANFGYSFEQCSKVFKKCHENYKAAEQTLKSRYVREQFSYLDKDQVQELLIVNDWDVKKTLATIFVQNCADFGIEESKAINIFSECADDVSKALEMSKIVRLAEITNKPEHFCFRVLTQCSWELEKAVNHIYAKI